MNRPERTPLILQIKIWGATEPLNMLLAILLVIGAAIVLYGFYNNYSIATLLQNTALEFAHDLEDARARARTNAEFLEVKAYPKEFQTPGNYKVLKGPSTLLSKPLPPEVSGVGDVILDSGGQPSETATFVFRKGNHSIYVTIDTSGTVSFPTK